MERYNVFQQRKISTWMMLVATMIWGMGFIAQSEGAKHVPPFFFNGVRVSQQASDCYEQWCEYY